MLFRSSLKMVRLILLTGPIAAILGGIAVGRIFAWSCMQIFNEKNNVEESKSKKLPSKSRSKNIYSNESTLKTISMEELLNTFNGSWVARSMSFVLLLSLYFSAFAFNTYCWRISFHMSHPSIIQMAQKSDGTVVKIDDYREAYNWIRENTPEDSRVMAWWDYGYQIAAIANRTTIADGNTWNHEHIALLGKIFTTNVDEAHSIARHLADYFLVWAGGGGDDLAKSPHLARIANSVYRDLCPSDPLCLSFGLVVSKIHIIVYCHAPGNIRVPSSHIIFFIPAPQKRTRTSCTG